MFGLIDTQQQTGQINSNNSLPYLQSEQFEVQIGHGVARVKVVQHYLNFNQNEQAHLEFYFPQSKSLVLESFLAELEQSKRNVESSQSSNQSDSTECKKEDTRITEKIGKIKYPNGILVDGWIRFKLAVVKPQESIITTVIYSQKLALSTQGEYQFQLPQQAITASYPISAKIHFEEREQENSITYHSVNHEVTTFQQPILLDNGASLQPLSLRVNYSHKIDQPFIINFSNKDYSNIQKIYLENSLFPNNKQEQDNSYALVTINPSQILGVNSSNNQFKLSQSQSEIIVLLDRSSSMGSIKFSEAIQGIGLLLRSLPTSSYFNIISQGSGNRLESIFEQSVAYSQENLNHSLNRINSFQNNLGTSFNMLNSLKHIEGQKTIANHARQIVLISDPSEPENKLEDLHVFFRNSKLGCPIHTVNAGQSQIQDSSIFEVISLITGGNSIGSQQTQNESVTDQILKVLPSLLYPTLSNLELDFKDSGKHITQVVPEVQSLKSIQFNQQISLVLALKNTSKETSLPISIKVFNSVLNKFEEHQIDLLSSAKEGSSHISNDLKKSLTKFCAHHHIIQIKDKNLDEAKTLSLQYSVSIQDHTSWVTKCYQLSDVGEKSLIPGQEQLSSIREKNLFENSYAQQTRKVSASSNLMHLYDNQAGEEIQQQQETQERSKSQDLNNLIDTIFTGEPQKQQQEQEQAQSKKSGSISSHGQNTDLLDIGDDVSQTTNPSQGQMSAISNLAQIGDPSSELNDDILDLIQNNNNNQVQQNNNQAQTNNGNAIDLLDDFLLGDSPSQSQSNSVSLIEILQNVNFDGLFNSNKFILSSLLNVNSDKFIGDKPENLTLDQWSTLLYLASVEKNFSQESLKWNIIAKKGKEQLHSVLAENVFNDSYQKQKVYLK